LDQTAIRKAFPAEDVLHHFVFFLCIYTNCVNLVRQAKIFDELKSFMRQATASGFAAESHSMYHGIRLFCFPFSPLKWECIMVEY